MNSIRDVVSSGYGEIIVVDNNSSDDTRTVLQGRFPEVQLIANNYNAGFGKANNQGMKIAKGDYMLLLNSDTIASLDAVRKCVDYMEGRSDIGVLGCQLRTGDNKLQLSAGRFLRPIHAVSGGIEFNAFLKRIGIKSMHSFEHFFTAADLENTLDVEWVAGAFMLTRRKVFDETAGFDENIFLYGEEMEWCFRIKKLGWRIIYFPLASITHIGKVSGRDLSDFKRHKLMLNGEIYFFKKHYGVIWAIIFKLCLSLGALIKIPLWGVVCLLRRGDQYYSNKYYFQLSILKWCFNRVK